MGIIEMSSEYYMQYKIKWLTGCLATRAQNGSSSRLQHCMIKWHDSLTDTFRAAKTTSSANLRKQCNLLYTQQNISDRFTTNAETGYGVQCRNFI